MPSYTPGTIRFDLPIELTDMPVIPTQFTVNDMIPTRAVVKFEIEPGEAPVMRSLDLSGAIPLKAGGPSKRVTSDSYWFMLRSHRDEMPEPIRELAAYAMAYVTEMLK